MFTCLNGDVFIGSIDTIREQKDAHYICSALDGHTDTIGINNIVQIYTNNASNMKSVANFLIHCFPSLYFQGSVAHCLNLLIGRLQKNNMGETNCEKGKSCLFHMITPCTISNMLLL
jgi:hypothetical protein